MTESIDVLLKGDRNPLQEHYQRFQVSKRILLSGHSHQAWPDAAYEGHMRAFEDAARWVDDKWGAAFEVADRVRAHLGFLMNVPADRIVLGASTHDLLLRFLSCLPLTQHSHIVTTDGEFHSMRRQLARLQEVGLQVSIVPVQPIESLAGRMMQAIRSDTIAIMASLVMFQDSSIFRDIEQVIDAAHQQGIATCVDSYHALNIVPFDVANTKLRYSFIVGGGYKYLQAGEGNCFMVLPESEVGWEPRPMITGWFAEFAKLQNRQAGVEYGSGHSAFAGSTYDPTSHYRANAVFRFFREQQLTPARLRSISHTQIDWLYSGIERLHMDKGLLDLPPKDELRKRGGFLALRSTAADRWVEQLKHANVYCDSRNGHLRLGPAPYVSRGQIEAVIETIERLSSKV